MLHRFSALEAFLDDKSETLKAHGLVFREMLLRHVIEGGLLSQCDLRLLQPDQVSPCARAARRRMSRGRSQPS